jgi:hypothetical protein
VLDDDFEVVAAAHGVPPPWIDDIGGSEAWGLLQAASVAMPGACRFKSDCLSAVQAVHNGAQKATAATNVYARVHNLLLAALDDTPSDRVIWVPAHKGEESVGALRCGNGERFTLSDLRGNEAADLYAKQAVLEHRVTQGDVHRWRQAFAEIKSKAIWIATVTVAAAGIDSEAARWKSDEAAVERRKAKKLGSSAKPLVTKVFARPVSLGGHSLVLEHKSERRGWRCTVCKCASGQWRTIAPNRCEGSAAVRWAHKAQLLAEHGVAVGGGHSRLLSGDVMWCGTCGCYADGKAVGLAAPCAGPPAKNGHGGMWGQLKKLRACKHPRTGAPLPPPVSEMSSCKKWQTGADAPAAFLSGTGVQHLTAHLVPAGGRSASLKALDMRDRIRAKATGAPSHR